MSGADDDLLQSPRSDDSFDDDDSDDMGSASTSSSSSSSSSSSDTTAPKAAASLQLTKAQILAEQAILARLLAANADLAASLDAAHLRAPGEPPVNPDKAGDLKKAMPEGLAYALPPGAAPILPISTAQITSPAYAGGGPNKVVYELALPPPPPPVDGAPPEFPIALARELAAANLVIGSAPSAELTADDIALQLSSPPVDLPRVPLKPATPRAAAAALTSSAPASSVARSVSTPISIHDHPLSPRHAVAGASSPADSPPMSPTSAQQRRRQAMQLPPAGVVLAAVGSGGGGGGAGGGGAAEAAALAAAEAALALGDKACQSCKKRKFQARATLADGSTRVLCKLCVVDVQRMQQLTAAPGGEPAADADPVALDWWRAASGRFRAKRQVDRDAAAAKRQPACGGARHALELGRLSHPAWCHVCHSLLWLPDGADVARCTAAKCAFVAHCSCAGGDEPLSVAAATCPSSAGAAHDAYTGAAFGVAVAEASAGRRNQLPIVVQDAVLYLLAHCGGEEGLLRHSGSHTLIQQMSRAYSAGAPVQLAGVDPHTVVGLFKLFFRDLSDRLIPAALDDQISERLAQAKARQESGAQVAIYLRDALQKLPRANYELCKFLSFFFVALERRESENKMSQSNILVCVAPTLQCTMGLFLHTMRHFETIFGAPPNVSQMKAATSKFATFDAIKH